MNQTQSGNVIFYILIAVALLAALSYSVTQSGRGGVGNISKDKAALHASEIIAYGNTLAQAVSQIRLRGYKDTEISLENSIISGYTNANCTDDECKIFHVSGGGVHYMEPKTDWLDSSFSAKSNYGDITFSGGSCTESTTCHTDGLDNEDLILFFPYMKKEICLALNDKLNVSNPSDDAPIDAACSGAGTGAKFTGTYANTLALKDSAGNLNRTAGCFRHDGGCATISGSYHYYQVLIER